MHQFIIKLEKFLAQSNVKLDDSLTSCKKVRKFLRAVWKIYSGQTDNLTKRTNVHRVFRRTFTL